ncbi:type 1 glutamine amidotransferase domain-containing protein [Staphylococcus pseudoxylosus]|uniref:type 1 glutamine amidotransferase domain-containing protein n=1 Tax=Staphylococcus pseudoxylosus TaxID=2282419 RepID=UPI00301AACA1
MKKIMIVNTSTDYFEGSSKATGLWLGELVHFYDYFNSKNYQIDLFNINGGSTPIDPVSLKPFMLDSMTKKYYNNESFMDMLSNSQSINEAKPAEYDVIYFTGGHGVMFDFPNNEAIQHAINEVYNHGGIVAAVCHGIAALLNVKDENGRYFIDNKEITGFSNTEEILANRKKIVPFIPYVKVDNRLVTGQNPQSPKQVAQAVDNILNKN